jgi:hypothetical protein
MAKAMRPSLTSCGADLPVKLLTCLLLIAAACAVWAQPKKDLNPCAVQDKAQLVRARLQLTYLDTGIVFRGILTADQTLHRLNVSAQLASLHGIRWGQVPGRAGHVNIQTKVSVAGACRIRAM